MGFTIRPLHAFSRFAQVERSAAAAWLLVGMLGCAGMATAAPVTLDIPAQDLAGALRAFSDQSGIQVLYEPSLLEGKRAGAVSGQMDSSAAVSRLLQGSGLRYRMEDGALLLLPPSDGSTVELGATDINSTGLGATTENTGSYTTGSVSIGKLPASIKDTPQSVSVITRQRIEDQRLNTINDVLTQTTGISAYEGGTNDSRYLSRGFEITNFRVDGGAPVSAATFASKDMDMAIYDHVEILRGADGLYSGNGEPGGSVNLVRKRPTAVSQFSITQSIGSWDNYRTELDISGPLGFDGRLRGRSVIVYQDRNGYMDKFDSDRKLFHGVLEADITDSTLFTIGYTRDRFNAADQTYGLPRYSDGSDLGLSRSVFLAGNHDEMIRDRDSVYARIEQRLSEDWTATVDAIYANQKQYRDYYNFYGAIDPLTHAGSTADWSYQDGTYRDRSIDLSLKGGFDLLGGRHDAVLGYTWQNSRWPGDAYSWASGGQVSAGDIFAFDPDDYPSHQGDTYRRSSLLTHSKQNGVYGSLRLQLADPLHLILGGRYNDYYNKWGFTGYDPTGAETFSSRTVYSDDNVFTPFAALTYRLSDEWTAYTSVADIYLSQASSLKGPPPGSSPLDPIRGRAYEIGIKGELFDGRLNTTTALYYIKREGEAMLDTRYPLTESGQGASCCWLDDGEVTSKGVEFEISGQIIERLEGTFGYTYNHNTSSNSTTNATALTLTPKHLGKAFITYRMPGALENLRIGAGISAQSASYVLEGDLDSSQQGYALYNAFADYRLNEHWSLALNGNNLADKKYYSTLGNSNYGNFYGDPRNFMLTLRGSY
ncbi:TonB-dependent siderophore receptor [Pseudomonas paralcaligenes]|uniref:TonB-dependent siderophore receptor n=1 Tax=Pseudomonas paralcaligenes TaxID=2772558 RepID=UPI001C7ED3EA|nr:TonB-dependent receptor [Pseudomonas paralcaligenes]